MHNVEETVDEFEAMWGGVGNAFPENQGSSRDGRQTNFHSGDCSVRGGKQAAWRVHDLDQQQELLGGEGTLEEELGKGAESSEDEISQDIADSVPKPSEAAGRGGHQSSEVNAGGDVEEGEVSDSSEETSKAGSQITHQGSQVSMHVCTLLRNVGSAFS